MARQKGLTFVFLNGCATRGHVVRLIGAGVPAAGTYVDVNDDVAADLSIRFYKDLAGALPLDKAWKNAVDYVRTVKGKNPSLCRRISWEGKREEEGRFPWFFEYNNEEKEEKGQAILLHHSYDQ